jgi:ribosomal protein L11 methyltransferase
MIDEWHIDWNEQWANHCPYYKDGELMLDLIAHNFAPQDRAPAIVRLKPGPGFGDLSHPTTNLCLKFLGELAYGKTVIDIGCGSGILTLAAAALGAKKAIGIDIEPEALSHAAENSLYNGLEKKTLFCLPESMPAVADDDLLIVMNMITSEQKIAWHSLPSLHQKKAFVIVSGMLTREKASYLIEVQSRGWILKKSLKQQSWLACLMDQNNAIKTAKGH